MRCVNRKAKCLIFNFIRKKWKLELFTCLLSSSKKKWYIISGDQLMEMKSVSQYIQKTGLLSHLDEYLFEYDKVSILVDTNIYNQYQKVICNALKQQHIDLVFQSEDIQNSDVVVGIGGGSIMDQAKYAAKQRHIDCILIPTSPTTDAPCTSIAVVEGKYVECGCPKKVLVDEQIMAMAPLRFFVCGIGDALTTYFEAQHYDLSVSVECLSRVCLDTLLTYGLQAKKDLEEGLLTSAVSKCLEAIIYMSGSVFSNSGSSAAHALSYGFQEICKDVMHGELTAFSLLVQLCIENDERIHELRSFYQAVGLPCHLKDIGIQDICDEELMKVIEKSMSEQYTMRKMPMIVQKEDLLEAIRVVDAFE